MTWLSPPVITGASLGYSFQNSFIFSLYNDVLHLIEEHIRPLALFIITAVSR